jgi:predicted dehydrogenase
MNKVKVGIVGVGDLGTLHAKLYKDIPDAEVVGIYDVDSNKLNTVAEDLGLNVFASLEEVIESSDAIDIVTPTSFHYHIAKKALEGGKHVFLERSITETVEQAEKLIALAKEKKCFIQVGRIERFNSAVLSLQDVNLEPLYIEAINLSSFNPRGSDVDVVFDLMIHDLDLIFSLLNSVPLNVDANSVCVISDSIDIANARVEFENGCVVNFTSSRISAKKIHKIRVFQKSTYLTLDLSQGFSEIFYIPEENQKPFHDGTLAFSLGEVEYGSSKKEIKYNRLERKNINPLRRELRTFTDAILNNVPPLVTAEDGLGALRLATQVLKKISEHKDKVKSVSLGD